MADPSDPAGLGAAGMATGASAALRQIVMDRIAAEQRAREAAQQQFTNNRLTANDARQAEEHAARMQDYRDSLAQRTQGERDTAAGVAFPKLGMGTAVEAPAFAKTFAGTSSEPNFTQERTLPSTQTAGGMSLDPSQPSVQKTTEAPRMITGRMVSMGTDAQRGDEEKKQLRDRLMSNPDLTDRERLMINMETAGLKVPANMEAKPPTHLVQAMKDGKPTFVNEGDAAGMTPYERPQSVSTVTIQTVDDKGNPVTRVVPKKDAMGKDFAKAPSAQDAAWTSKRNDAIQKLGIVDQSIDAAKDLIGPGAGRVSTLEQMLGNPDPRISDLKTKLLTVKDQVVGALTRSNRQPSPAMMKRFDELLGTQLTPESLHAATHALREMLATEGTATSGAAKADPLGIR